MSMNDGLLPMDLVSNLPYSLRDALDHPVRRDVLRVLNAGAKPRSIAALTAQLPPYKADQIAYHLRVLQGAGAIDCELTGMGSRRIRNRYGGEVCEDPIVQPIGRATVRQDRQYREAAAAASMSPLLTMFRLPRPVVDIR